MPKTFEEHRMSSFIGDNLTKREIAALQCVANNSGGSQFGSASKLLETIQNHRDCWAIEDVSMEELSLLFDKLESECLIERRVIKGENYVGLTDEGENCNLITVCR
jgi:hypothetical protein